MEQPSRHIIFDLDGTIIDSKEEIVKTYHSVFLEIPPDHPPLLETVNPGATLSQVMSIIYGSGSPKMEKAKLLFASIYDQSDYLETSLYPAVFETLRELKAARHQLYIATNKRYKPTIRILEKKEISPFFASVITSDIERNVSLTKRQMIESLQSKFLFSSGIMVGDMISDIEAGNNQKLETVAVTYGYERREILATENPTYTIDSFKDLLKVMQA